MSILSADDCRRQFEGIEYIGVKMYDDSQKLELLHDQKILRSYGIRFRTIVLEPTKEFTSRTVLVAAIEDENRAIDLLVTSTDEKDRTIYEIKSLSFSDSSICILIKTGLSIKFIEAFERILLGSNGVTAVQTISGNVQADGYAYRTFVTYDVKKKQQVKNLVEAILSSGESTIG